MVLYFSVRKCRRQGGFHVLNDFEKYLEIARIGKD